MNREEFIDMVTKVSLFRCKNYPTNSQAACRDIVDQIIDIAEGLGMLPPNDKYTNSDDEELAEHYNKWDE